jgi:hypothetical protein
MCSRAGADTHSNADADTAAAAYTNTDGYANGNANTNTNADADADRYRNSDTDCYTHAASDGRHIRNCPLLLESNSWSSAQRDAHPNWHCVGVDAVRRLR